MFFVSLMKFQRNPCLPFLLSSLDQNNVNSIGLIISQNFYQVNGFFLARDFCRLRHQQLKYYWNIVLSSCFNVICSHYVTKRCRITRFCVLSDVSNFLWSGY